MAKVSVEIGVTANVHDALSKVESVKGSLKSLNKDAEQSMALGNGTGLLNAGKSAAIAQTPSGASIPYAPVPKPDRASKTAFHDLRSLTAVFQDIGNATHQAALAGNRAQAREYGQLQNQVRQQYRDEIYAGEQTDKTYDNASREVAQAEEKKVSTAHAAAEAAQKAAEAAQKAEIQANKQAEADKKAAEATQAAEKARAAASEATEKARIAAAETTENKQREILEKAVQAAEAEAERKEKAAQRAVEAAKKAAEAAQQAEDKHDEAEAQKKELAKAAEVAVQEAEAKKVALVEASEAKKAALAEQTARIHKYTDEANQRKAAIDQSGAGLEPEQRIKQEQQVRFMRGINRFFGHGANVIGQAGSGNVAGAVLGTTGGIGDFISHLPKGALIGGAVVGGLTALVAGANKLSEQWEKVMQPSMALAASLGKLSDDADRNHAVFQEVFARATDRNVLHGYKVEEGIALANQLSKLGVNPDNVGSAEEQIFRYQRATDADRNTLTQAAGLSRRYQGGEDILGYALGGLKESGMQPGQYQEYLNATLRIFEEGLSRGVVKGFADITRTQNMLGQLGDTWKGEKGAERIVQMEDAISGASNLESDYDVIMYQAARKMAGEHADYIDVSKLLEQGLGNGDILTYIHDIVKDITGGDRQSGIIQYKKMFGLNTEAAEELWNALKTDSIKDAKTILEEPSSKAIDETPEGKLLSATEEIQKDVALIGSWFTGPKADIVDAISRLTGAMTGDRKFSSSVVEIADILSYVGSTGNRQRNAGNAFEKALTTPNQPDGDNNGEGDYAQRAKSVLDDYKGLPVGVQYFAAMNPQNQLFQALDMFKSEKDFTEENTQMARGKIAFVRNALKDITEDELKRDYVQWAQGKIQENKLSSQDEVLRLLISGGSDKVLKKIMPMIDKYTNYGKEGDTINAFELNEMYYTLSKDNDMKEAMEWANSTIGRFNRLMRNLPAPSKEGDEARTALQNYRYMLPINELEGLFTEAMESHSEGGTVITKSEMIKILEGINNLIMAVEKDKTTVVIGP